MDDLRLLTDLDAAALARAFALRHAVFVVEQRVPLDLERDDNDATARHVLVEDGGGQALGTGRVRLVAPALAKVERVAVAGAARGLGVGRRVMDALEAEAARLGAREVTLAAQESAIPFYVALGYVAEGERFWDAGIPHRKMRRGLGGG
ncbi:MAG: GNAT family N-acetyltransferase [Myxococcales bacterium]|nr:GNAT family N-acetyltransferase [Myxococcales bacterium]MCB9732326.1 GNAT family N-acetyltransferase [Deltaproteobacteria bacterium]